LAERLGQENENAVLMFPPWSLSCTWTRIWNEHQRCANKPAQGNALGKSSFKDKALKGRDNVWRHFQGFVLSERKPTPAPAPRLPWAGLLPGLWPLMHRRFKAHDRS
jgi:hypothetical protein